jgi:hypothetical protein
VPVINVYFLIYLINHFDSDEHKINKSNTSAEHGKPENNMPA